MAGKSCGLSIKLIPFWSAITHARNRRRVMRCLILHSIAILSLPFEACNSGIEYLCAHLRSGMHHDEPARFVGQ